ncbi:hypothetical protein HYH03_005183 [Edaphochlamys debaryana]|uniref:Peptidase M11 gametolysin domain-containing protein n=1 Tax=Edaphochlamys debaryana TaxID=47281 RepID=A0A835YDF3_9CHLO|nr:hypothetical protein HYH03_005183 [Edaphochlamys debaryana]|eukprot:KAG2496775.1 hypothetical protein HYH03_005183 [Edaphochlamys debaryana]
MRARPTRALAASVWAALLATFLVLAPAQEYAEGELDVLVPFNLPPMYFLRDSRGAVLQLEVSPAALPGAVAPSAAAVEERLASLAGQRMRVKYQPAHKPTLPRDRPSCGASVGAGAGKGAAGSGAAAGQPCADGGGGTPPGGRRLGPALPDAVYDTTGSGSTSAVQLLDLELLAALATDGGSVSTVQATTQGPPASPAASPAAPPSPPPPLAAAPPPAAPIGAAPVNVTTAIFLLSFCGYPLALSRDEFMAQWVDGPSTGAGAYTMEGYVRACSHGRSRLNNDTQLVFAVDVPCTGLTTDYKPYNSTDQCRGEELYSWMNQAEAIVEAQYNISLAGIKQRLVVLPREMDAFCPWAGLASQGCIGTRCYVWVNGNSASDLSVFLHELGHNWGLNHAGTEWTTDEYADTTDPMGMGYACFAANGAWKLGWALPLPGADLSSATLAVGRWRSFQLPYQARSYASHVRIYPDWVPPNATQTDRGLPVPAFFVSLRQEALPYEWWGDEIPSPPGRVLVHASRLTQATMPPLRTKLEAIMARWEWFRAPLPYGIVVRVYNIKNATGASVSVCRRDREAESRGDGSCRDGLDNDCDGSAPAPTQPAPAQPPATLASAPQPTQPSTAQPQAALTP